MKSVMNILWKKSVVIVTVCLSASIFFQACQVNSVQTLPKRNYQLVWSDDFTGNAGASPDATKWGYDIGNNNGWGNSELEYYTARPKNVSLDGNGNLVITAYSEPFAGASFTSARINTKSLFSQSYGRFEARIKTPSGPGVWPAFWLLGANIDQVSWPLCGEIDIMEQRGQEPYINLGSLHGPGYSAGSAITKSYSLTNSRFDNAFHIYAVEWGVDYIDFFVDDYLYQHIASSDVTRQWVFDHPFFIILNVAVGGNFVGFPTNATPFPQSMYVDYVKVYKQ